MHSFLLLPSDWLDKEKLSQLIIFFPTDRRIKVRFSELKEAFPNLKSEMRIWYIMPDIAMQLKVTHTFDTQLFSQVSPFSTFQRRSLQNEKYLDPNLRIYLILKNFSRVLENFHFSRSRSRGIFISLITSGKDWIRFSFHFSKKVNQIFISLFTSRTFNIHSRRTLILTAIFPPQ